MDRDVQISYDDLKIKFGLLTYLPRIESSGFFLDELSDCSDLALIQS